MTRRSPVRMVPLLFAIRRNREGMSVGAWKGLAVGLVLNGAALALAVAPWKVAR